MGKFSKYEIESLTRYFHSIIKSGLGEKDSLIHLIVNIIYLGQYFQMINCEYNSDTDKYMTGSGIIDKNNKLHWLFSNCRNLLIHRKGDGAYLYDLRQVLTEWDYIKAAEDENLNADIWAALCDVRGSKYWDELINLFKDEELDNNPLLSAAMM